MLIAKLTLEQGKCLATACMNIFVIMFDFKTKKTTSISQLRTEERICCNKV